jgi:5-methylcytosine-specific restriction enzyme A
MPITSEQIVAAYSLASKVFDDTVRPEAAASVLHSQYGLNKSSARDFIGQYRSLMHGVEFKRTMSAPAMEYFLTQILQDRGSDAAQRALSSARKHVEYYERIRSTTLHRFRSVLDAFELHLSLPKSVQAVEIQFEAAVAKSRTDSAEARRLRLQKAKKTPGTVTATTTLYVRNPDVVVEVLSRANGQCELCNSPAPFKRKADGSPYLEVHHKVQLSKGGEDTVENAVASCPNCHRREHFGEAQSFVAGEP